MSLEPGIVSAISLSQDVQLLQPALLTAAHEPTCIGDICKLPLYYRYSV